ncbi:MAG: glutamine synthetase family protein [Candidatus Scalinduaceae bacterium]
MTKKSTKDQTASRIKKDNVKFIQLQFTDITGSIKSVTIPTHKLSEALNKGLWFDGSSIEGFTRIFESDMFLKPEPETYILLPWEPKESPTARFICDVFTPDGKPFEGDPRFILKRACNDARAMGLEYNVGTELEFFLFKPSIDSGVEPIPHDVGGYFDFSPRDLAGQVRNEIVTALESMGLEVELSHHEVAPGQHEIDFRFSDAISTADNAITLKLAVKSIAHKHGLYATFMPKPIYGINGSGMHCHQSLFNLKNRKNAFYSSKNEYRLSDVARNFIAGQLKHIREMISILAPTVNSYKRLVPGFEAPVYICWGQKNRSSLIRIPRYSKGREQSTRAELRCPDPSGNPYLAFAVMLESGLEGMRKKMKIPPPVEENVYEFDFNRLSKLGIDTLPDSLGEATQELKNSKLMEKALGPHTYKTYINAKTIEWNEYRTQVTEWEHKKYFEVT